MTNMKYKAYLIIPVFFAGIWFLSSFSAQQPVPKAVMARGKTVYEMVCLSCHQADGTGVPRMNPPLTGSKTLKGPKEKIIIIALNGLSGVEIDGEGYDNVMASHADLKDQELADVLTYVRNSFGNKGSLVTAEEVKKTRIKLKK
jgi:mono/diheme cytochrome c family protein